MAEQARTMPSSANRLDATMPARGIRNLRWYICGLVFLATILNYIDRQVFSILAPDLQRDIGWSELDYGRIVIAFQVSYAVSLILCGRLIDMIGAKLGYTLSVIWWSFAEIAHALSRTPFGFGAARAALGIGEGANFPTAMKAISEWFPKTETGMATGILNSGPTIGAIVAPLLVPLIAAKLGWKGAFVVTGVVGIPWVFAWWKFYHSPAVHPNIMPEELAYIQSGRPTILKHRVSLRKLLGYRQTWAIPSPGARIARCGRRPISRDGLRVLRCWIHHWWIWVISPVTARLVAECLAQAGNGGERRDHADCHPREQGSRPMDCSLAHRRDTGCAPELVHDDVLHEHRSVSQPGDGIGYRSRGRFGIGVNDSVCRDHWTYAAARPEPVFADVHRVRNDVRTSPHHHSPAGSAVRACKARLIIPSVL